ncbi:MAG: hypothetical protein HY598_02120 [Candidatus Omnitrophica bacterium]|nr:hypothetical protein [Candidatus Omnitrophota bacterium]
MINRIAGYGTDAGAPLMTTLGIVSGEILTDLEQHGPATLRYLIRELNWPVPVVMMAVGALIREGLIQARQHELEILIELRREWAPLQAGEARWAD